MIAPPKLLIWTYIPTHHQSAFLQALRDDGIDLVVHYFMRVSSARIRLGWSDPKSLPEGERFVAPHLASLEECSDWRERIHVVPGYGARFLLALAIRLSQRRVAWLAWSEPSRDSVRWYLNYPVKRLYAELVNRYALGALAIGDMARKDLVRWGIDERRIRFLPYSVAPLPSDARASAASGPGSTRFIFVGALCSRKGVDVLLRAFQIVLRTYARATLRLVGYDETGSAYRQLAQKLGVTQAVEFVGPLPAAQIADSLHDSDVLILPSRFDGWGMVVNEAASLGKAIIATDACGAAYHLIVPGRNGFRVPPEDQQALATAMERYCRDPNLAASHGEKSLAAFAEFTPARNAARMRECLGSLLADPNAAGGERYRLQWTQHD